MNEFEEKTHTTAQGELQWGQFVTWVNCNVGDLQWEQFGTWVIWNMGDLRKKHTQQHRANCNMGEFGMGANCNMEAIGNEGEL